MAGIRLADAAVEFDSMELRSKLPGADAQMIPRLISIHDQVPIGAARLGVCDFPWISTE